MKRKSLLPEAKKNLESWEKLHEEAECLKTDFRNLRENIEHKMGDVARFKGVALETICRDVRQDEPGVFYCANQDNCPYKGDTTRITTKDGEISYAPMCRITYDYLRLKGLLK